MHITGNVLNLGMKKGYLFILSINSMYHTQILIYLHHNSGCKQSISLSVTIAGKAELPQNSEF